MASTSSKTRAARLRRASPSHLLQTELTFPYTSLSFKNPLAFDSWQVCGVRAFAAQYTSKPSSPKDRTKQTKPETPGPNPREADCQAAPGLGDIHSHAQQCSLSGVVVRQGRLRVDL